MTTIEQRRRMHADFQAATKRDKTNRLAVAGRFFLYVFIAPLLMIGALIIVATLFY